MPRRMLVVATVAFAVGIAPAPARACKCKFPSFTRALKRSDAVFLGKLVSVKKGSRKQRTSDRFVFVVDRVWKGKPGRTVTVYSKRTSCGLRNMRLEPGKRYLVYAEDRDGLLFSRQCRRTRRFASKAARADVARLGKGRPGRPRVVDDDE